jgi:hypothetical protein
MSVYKSFRTPVAGAQESFGLSMGLGFNSRYDQPTYTSFRLQFGGGYLGPYQELREEAWYNSAQAYIQNYDRMPHPLLMKGTDTDIENRESYSSIDYLKDSNEFTRAKMLEEFRTKLHSLQTYNQWYFQKIEGVQELLKVNPTQGQRIPDDTKLTITAIDGLDGRMTHLLNLYKKIVWDDVYQRWVLPDMMRYFTLKIYLSEYREFHTPNQYGGNGTAERTANSGEELQLHLLDDILPTWIIECQMCEFDLEDVTYEALNGLDVGSDPEPAQVTFKIKVGNIKEKQIYPVFTNMYLYDQYLNGYERAVEKDPANPDYDYDSTAKDSGVEHGNAKTIFGVAQNHDYPNTKRGESEYHTSGTPYNEMANDKSLFGAIPKGGPGPDGVFFTNDDKETVSDKPETWVNNAIDFGTSYLKNLGTKYVDKAKMTSIPGLGVSFEDAKAALESKNIVTALGIIRRGINTVAAGYIEPSELLSGEIVDDIFQKYLTGVISKATTETEDKSMILRNLEGAAATALNDKGIWDEVKDYSMATDLVGRGESNEDNPIEGESNLINITKRQTKGDLSKATDLTGPKQTNVENKVEVTAYGQILEGVPSSQATNNDLTIG